MKKRYFAQSQLYQSQKDMMRFVEVVKANIGKVVKMTFKQSTYEKKDLLTFLTDKQRELTLPRINSWDSEVVIVHAGAS